MSLRSRVSQRRIESANRLGRAETPIVVDDRGRDLQTPPRRRKSISGGKGRRMRCSRVAILLLIPSLIAPSFVRVAFTVSIARLLARFGGDRPFHSLLRNHSVWVEGKLNDDAVAKSRLQVG